MTEVTAAWPTDEQVWDSIRLTFGEKIAEKLSFKRWKDGIDIDYPTSEAMSFARQMFAMGFMAAQNPDPAATPASDRGAQALRVVRQMVEAFDSGNLQMSSPEIGEPENDIPYHPWHEEMLHYARLALEPAALAAPQAQEGRDQYEFPYQRTFDAICAAVDTLRGSGGSYSVSVKSFQDKFNNHRDAEASPLKAIDTLVSRPNQPKKENEDG